MSAKKLYVQVIVGIVLGVLVGYIYPELGQAVKPLSDVFIRLIKMLIAPIVFLTIVTGVTGMQSMRSVAKIGGSTIVYFLVTTTLAFNLDGTAIYLTLAAIFIAQATHVDLTVWQQLLLLSVMVISSKGAAGVTGSGFIVLASSLAAIGSVPVAGVVLILGIDRFMSEGRSLTNMMGNIIATLIISKWQQAIDQKKLLLLV